MSFCEPKVGASPRRRMASNSAERAIISQRMKSMYMGYFAAVITRNPSQSKSRTRKVRRMVASKRTRGRVKREASMRPMVNQ